MKKTCNKNRSNQTKGILSLYEVHKSMIFCEPNSSARMLRITRRLNGKAESGREVENTQPQVDTEKHRHMI